VADSIPSRFFAQGRTRPGDPAAHVRKPEGWHALTWAEYTGLTRRITRALIALGFAPGQATCILGFNRVEWVTFALATQAAGGAPAGIYTTCSPVEVQYIVDHAEAAIVLVEDAAQFAKIAAERERLPRLRHVVLMEGAAVDDPLALTWAQFLARGESVPDAAVDERVRGIHEDDTATYIYTSGTTGPPKAVMLSHAALLWTADTMAKLMAFSANEVMVSYLPLSHIAEQLLSIYGPVTVGIQIYFAQALEKLPDNLKEAQPTIFFGVPRIWEKFHAAVRGKLAQATGVKKRLVDWAMGVARRVHALQNHGEALPTLLALQYALAQRLVFRKLKTALGLGRAKLCVSGAAPIAAEVLEFFTGLDIVVLEVYGQSEDCGPTSINLPGQTRFGAVGKPLPGLEVRLAEDGEILVRGRSLFKGYFKEPTATGETLIDGWLHSGDLGSFDADGFLHITGRKKEIIITAGGKNIAPKNIEAALKNHPLVEEAVVIGDRRKYLGALLTLQPTAAAWLREHGHPEQDPVHEHPALLAELGRWVESVNRDFARVEHVRKFKVLPRSLTQEHGELTPTLKLKRRIIDKNWSESIESMFTADE
jgi:long-chain acyl-CoA synthetase